MNARQFTWRWLSGWGAVALLVFLLWPRPMVGVREGDVATIEVAGPFLASPGGQTAEADLKQPGRVLLLDFWATWCAPCVAALPEFNALVEHFRGQPVTFLAITNEEMATVEDFMRSRPILAIVALDTQEELFRQFGVQVLPTQILIGRDGKIAAVSTSGSPITAEQVQAELDRT